MDELNEHPPMENNIYDENDDGSSEYDSGDESSTSSYAESRTVNDDGIQCIHCDYDDHKIKHIRRRLENDDQHQCIFLLVICH